jgi:hypothetical protein
VPKQLPFKTLHELSGLACRPNDFRTRVCKALDELTSADTPAEMQVSSYQVSADRKAITVSLSSWRAANKSN